MEFPESLIRTMLPLIFFPESFVGAESARYEELGKLSAVLELQAITISETVGTEEADGHVVEESLAQSFSVKNFVSVVESMPPFFKRKFEVGTLFQNLFTPSIAISRSSSFLIPAWGQVLFDVTYILTSLELKLAAIFVFSLKACTEEDRSSVIRINFIQITPYTVLNNLPTQRLCTFDRHFH